MTNYHILFLDIDGTILRPDDTIEESTKEAVTKVQEKGIEVFLATGRPLHEIRDIGKELNIHSFIGYNGAYAVHREKEVFKEYMPKSTIERYLQISTKNKHEMVLYTNSKNTFTSFESPLVEEFIHHFHLKENDSFSNNLINDILGITVMGVSDDEYTLYEDSDIHLSQVNVEGLGHCYDVIRNKVNKGIAVQAILRHLNISPENAIAFGDGMNDKEMLSYVGESFAMGNANPNLFTYAKHKTTDVMNAGIYNGLKSLGLL